MGFILKDYEDSGRQTELTRAGNMVKFTFPNKKYPIFIKIYSLLKALNIIGIISDFKENKHAFPKVVINSCSILRDNSQSVALMLQHSMYGDTYVFLYFAYHASMHVLINDLIDALEGLEVLHIKHKNTQGKEAHHYRANISAETTEWASINGGVVYDNTASNDN